MKQEDLFDIILAYTEGTLSADEQVQFEKRLESDPALQEEYEAYSAAAKSISHLGFDVLDPKTEEAGKVVNLPKQKEKSRWYIGIAASLLIAVSAWFLMPSEPAEDQLAQLDNYNLELIYKNTRAGEENDPVAEILEDMHKQSYDSAIMKIKNLRSSSNQTDYLNYLEAFAQQQLGNYKQAFNAWQSIKEDSSSAYQVSAYWQSGMTLIEQGKKDEAKTIFNKIASDPSHPLAGKAKEVLELLSD